MTSPMEIRQYRLETISHVQSVKYFVLDTGNCQTKGTMNHSIPLCEDGQHCSDETGYLWPRLIFAVDWFRVSHPFSLASTTNSETDSREAYIFFTRVVPRSGAHGWAWGGPWRSDKLTLIFTVFLYLLVIFLLICTRCFQGRGSLTLARFSKGSLTQKRFKNPLMMFESPTKSLKPLFLLKHQQVLHQTTL